MRSVTSQTKCESHSKKMQKKLLSKNLTKKLKNIKKEKPEGLGGGGASFQSLNPDIEEDREEMFSDFLKNFLTKNAIKIILLPAPNPKNFSFPGSIPS